MIKITPNEFTLLSKYIFDISGIFLSKGKEYLIETRLNPILEQSGSKNFHDLYNKSKNDFKKQIEKQIIDAISTNETYFFRDITPFEMIQQKLIPEYIEKISQKKKASQQIRIWCAANSTGQEIYSIAMILKELGLDLDKYNIKLFGTDISNAAISQATYGKYNKFEIARGLSQERIQRHFTKDADGWRINEDLRSMVSFKKMNLMEPFIGLGKFDFVFCRNVAIYFTQEDRKKLYSKIANVMDTNASLIIGATESLTNDTDLFMPQRYLKTVFYKKRLLNKE